MRCDHSCYECAGPGERNCTTCVSGYTFEDGVCLVSTICKDANEESWAEGSFCVLVKKNNLCQRKVLQQLCWQYLSHSGKCHPCDVSCGRCRGPESDDCISCPDSRVLLGHQDWSTTVSVPRVMGDDCPSHIHLGIPTCQQV
ncbi:unnamed protein product [Boreogadus saida]